MGLPFEMQDAKTIASAPRSTSIFARGMIRFPGHPPQVTNPTISTGPVSLKCAFSFCSNFKICCPRTDIFCHEAADDADVHG